MGALDLVQRCWSDLAAHGCCATPAAVLHEMAHAYGEPHRHYHTLDHIAALLALLERHAEAASDRDALALAILFHDIVYDPGRQDNEEASAVLAAARLAGLGFAQGLVAKVARYIRATRHDGSAEAAGDADLALLLDLDLSILAAVPGEYQAYAHAVRREYALVPDQLYRPGRRRVLQAFLAREQIYLTERLRAAWEERARTNLASEIAELG